METRYIPEIELKRIICENCGDSAFVFTKIEIEPYLCLKCDNSLYLA